MIEPSTITIIATSEARTQDAVMFKAPDNYHVSHEIFLFLAENLQPGFVVELATNGRLITQPSSKDKRYTNFLKALAAYVKTNKDGSLDAFLSGYAPEDWQEAKGESNARI